MAAIYRIWIGLLVLVVLLTSAGPLQAEPLRWQGLTGNGLVFRLQASANEQPFYLERPEIADAHCWPETQKCHYTSHWLQLASQQVLQHIPGNTLRIWRFGASQSKTFNPCQYAPSNWSDCWSVLLHWSQERAFLLLYQGLPFVYLLAQTANAPPQPFNHPRMLMILNINSGDVEQLISQPFDFVHQQASCLTASHWILQDAKISSSSLRQLLAINYQQRPTEVQHVDSDHEDFTLACTQAQILSDPSQPFAAWKAERSPEWERRAYQAKAYPLSWDGGKLLSLHQYGYFMHQDLQKSGQTERLMPPAELLPELCQQQQNQLYCLDTQQHWYYLNLQAEKLHVKPLLDVPWQEQKMGLNLMGGYTKQGVILQRKQRQILLHPTPGGPVWVTDQGHFFRQGEIAAAEMPYLVQGLKSVDLPARLESWTEVARALKGLPPLKASGLKLIFAAEDVCQNINGC